MDEAVTHLHLKNTVREACVIKRRFDFMCPPNLYELLNKVNSLPAIYPDKFNNKELPGTLKIFLSNLNRILSQKQKPPV